MRFNRFKIQPNTTNCPYKNKLFFFILPFFHIFFKWNSVLHVTNSIQNQMLNSREFPNILSSAFNPNQGAPPTTSHTPCLLWPHPLKLRNVNRCIEKNNKRKKTTTNKQREKQRPDQAQTETMKADKNSPINKGRWK